MSAHFDGGAHIEGRRLREVEVSYVEDPTLCLDDEDSDDCPASPPPTYYLRVREKGRRSSDSNASSREQVSHGSELHHLFLSTILGWSKYLVLLFLGVKSPRHASDCLLPVLEVLTELHFEVAAPDRMKGVKSGLCHLAFPFQIH